MSENIIPGVGLVIEFKPEAFAQHCWRAGSNTSLNAILDDLAPISTFGHTPGILDAVREKMLESIEWFDIGLDGQNVARILDPERFRNVTALEARRAAIQALETKDLTGSVLPVSAQLAALAAVCDLGSNAIAGAWAYSFVQSAKIRAGLNEPIEPTGLPVPADEVAMVLAGLNPDTRLPMFAEEWEAVTKTLNYTSGSMLLLCSIVSQGVLSKAGSREQLDRVLALVPHRHPPVVEMLNAAFRVQITE